MIIKKLDNIRMSLLKSKSDLDDNGKVNYESVITVNFKVNDFVRESFDDDNVDKLLELIYSDALVKGSEIDTSVDSIGVWLTYDGHTFESAIKLQTLGDMKRHGAEDVNPIYEFCKMTIHENDI